MKKHILSTLIAAVFFLPTVLHAAPPLMSSGWVHPTDLAWTGNNGGSTGDPKQPWNVSGNIFGYLASNYPVSGRQHVGLDIRTKLNEPVYAIADGVIHRYINASSPGDRAVFCKHQLSNGTWFYVVYGHTTLKSGLSVGQTVKAGQQISYTADSNNTHVHFGVSVSGNFSNGWGRLDTGLNAYNYGWRPPRTWLLANTPKGGGTVPEPTGTPNLTITAVSNKTTARPGDTFIVTYTIKNNGDGTAQSISLSAAAPNYATVVSSTPTGSTSSSSYAVAVPQLAAGATTTVAVTYRVL